MVALWQLKWLDYLDCLAAAPTTTALLQVTERGGSWVEEGQKIRMYLSGDGWSWIPSSTCHSQADWQLTALLPSAGKSMGPTPWERGGGWSRLLLRCLHKIPGPRHNHDNYRFAIRGMSTKRWLRPAMRNGQTKIRRRKLTWWGDFAVCDVCQGGRLSGRAHLDQPVGYGGCFCYSLQPFSMTLDRKITQCKALVT